MRRSGGGTGTGDATTDGPAGVSSSYNALEQTTTQTPSGQQPISFTYSGPYQDDRLSQTHNGTTTTFTNSSLGVTAEQTGVAGQPTYFIRDNKGNLVEERVWNISSLSYVTYYYLFDALGTVTGLDSNGSATTPDNAYTYAPFGGASSANEAVSNPFRFAGYYLDSATSLYHVGQRYYDPSSGVPPWQQRDPISNPADPGSWNRYVYSGDDPINYTDPTGRFCASTWGAGFAITFGADLPIVVGVAAALILAPELAAPLAIGFLTSLAGVVAEAATVGGVWLQVAGASSNC